MIELEKSFDPVQCGVYREGNDSYTTSAQPQCVWGLCTSCIFSISLIVMWLALAWKRGFAVREVAPTLSHQRISDLKRIILNSLNRDCTHINSVVALTIA